MAIYGGLHALPAIIWSVLIPFQHVDSLRRKFPAMHRTSGYVILSFSLLLSMTGYWFFLSKNAYSHANWYHLHDLGGFAAPLAWPTFEATTFLLAPFYWATMYKTAVTASAGDYAAHRKWAVLHTMTACFISLERVAIIIMTGAGLVLTLFPEEEVHAFFGVPDTVDAIAAAELDLFAFGNIIALGLAAAWAAYELNRAGQLDGWKRYLSSMVQEEPVAKKVD
ncbi:hypothetical protein K4F52_000492 [Lecanicillium sp. MT-2017a]|nr:hypothetical protein K4F52_000492 [Lecanicillium sp. MT-2017a]